jgi:CxxH/CxxC protein (TIGR04129 family)
MFFATFFACPEHVERAIEKFVDEYEEAPDLARLSAEAPADGAAAERCGWCDRPAEYRVASGRQEIPEA